jgi:hypothetical protein
MKILAALDTVLILVLAFVGDSVGKTEDEDFQGEPRYGNIPKISIR